MQRVAPANPEVLQVGSRLLWTAIAGMAIAIIAIYWAAGLSLDCRSLPAIAIAFPLCAVVAIFYRFFRTDMEIVYSTEAIMQITLIGFLGALLAYAAATLRLPYRDAELLAIDRWLGLDLRSYMDFVNSHPRLAVLSVLVYLSMMWQPAIIFVALALNHRIERLHSFAVALIISLLITVVIFALVPALGWYGYLRIEPTAFPKLQLFWNFAAHIDAVRSGELRAIPLGDLRGIISFPSYHTAVAVLAIWAVWPVRFMRWPMLILNVLMAASAPIEGAHYFVDILGGVVVGLCAATVASRIERTIRRRCTAGALEGPAVVAAEKISTEIKAATRPSI